MLRRAYTLGLLPLAITWACGCGGPSNAPDLGEVTGTVTDGGAPVVDASVEFSPEQGRPSVGTTDAEGRYTLRYTVDAGGAKIGVHTVRITPYSEPPPPPGSGNAAAAPPPAKPIAIPDPVTVASGENVFDFKLDQLGS